MNPMNRAGTTATAQVDAHAERHLDVAEAHALHVTHAVVHPRDERQEDGRADAGHRPLPPRASSSQIMSGRPIAADRQDDRRPG